ncbi:hypothetical protein ACFSBG_07730, partial [Georgenia yuyongxinii]
MVKDDGVSGAGGAVALAFPSVRVVESGGTLMVHLSVPEAALGTAAAEVAVDMTELVLSAPWWDRYEELAAAAATASAAVSDTAAASGPAAASDTVAFTAESPSADASASADADGAGWFADLDTRSSDGDPVAGHRSGPGEASALGQPGPAAAGLDFVASSGPVVGDDLGADNADAVPEGLEAEVEDPPGVREEWESGYGLTSAPAVFLERLAPGGRLASVLGGMCVGDADDATIVEAIAGAERLASWAMAVQARAVRELTDRRGPTSLALTSAGAEISARLGITGYAGQAKVHFAAGLDL